MDVDIYYIFMISKAKAGSKAAPSNMFVRNIILCPHHPHHDHQRAKTLSHYIVK